MVQIKQISIKTIYTLILSILLSLILAESKECSSQTIAIGHMTAEVIESISAASNTITSFEIETITDPNTVILNQINITSETINLGLITLNSGRAVIFSVVVEPATLSDRSGNGFTLSTLTKDRLLALAAQPNGSQSIQLDGLTNIAIRSLQGFLHGSFCKQLIHQNNPRHEYSLLISILSQLSRSNY